MSGTMKQVVLRSYARGNPRAEDFAVETVPVPEPSAALVFGLGLFAASRFARRKR